MIKPNQKIKIRLVRPNLVEYYTQKGYKGKTGEDIIVKAEDLTPVSHKKIVYICDYCGEEFERIVYSNERSKKGGNTKDACTKCSRNNRAKETCNIKYGVDNPMKVDDFYFKNRESVSAGFDNDVMKSCTAFVNGIPVSQGQIYISELIEESELNFKYDRYYIDIVKDNVAIEYDGKGHDLEVRMGKKSQEDFDKKEKTKTFSILQNFRLLRIIDKKDRFRKGIPDKYRQEILDFFDCDNISYKEIIVE